MNYGYDQCSDPTALWLSNNGANMFSSAQKASSDDEVILAASCPKKRAGRKKFKETRHPVYRGVRQRNGNRWVCELRTPNNKSRIWLGTYLTAEMAARAHDVAALALRGRSACLNFADSAWRLPVPASTSTEDIQRAAAEAAEMFRSPESEVTFESSSSKANHYDEVCTSQIQMEDGNNYEALSGNAGAYMDDEAVFDMPGLLTNMAEGLMLPPPHTPYGDFTRDDTESDCEVSLWSYSI